MKILLILLSLFSATEAFATVRVAVIDTGIKHNGDFLCRTGHEDFTGHGYYDTSGHGTNISGIIHEANIDRDYCQIILKYSTGVSSEDPITNTIKAFKVAIKEGVNIINYSSAGTDSDYKERDVIRQALDAGIVVVVAVGNSGYNLDKSCVAFPACYDKRLVVVGRNPKNYGNYGSIVDFYVDGTSVTGFGVTMSGTSQAAARVTANFVTKLARKKK